MLVSGCCLFKCVCVCFGKTQRVCLSVRKGRSTKQFILLILLLLLLLLIIISSSSSSSIIIIVVVVVVAVYFHYVDTLYNTKERGLNET